MRVVTAYTVAMVAISWQLLLPGPADSSQDTEVLVLGAGMAGIAAAKALQDRGVGFILVEASGRLGGRVHSKLFGGHRVELGAQWIHEVDPGETQLTTANPLWATALSCGLRGNFTDLDSFVMYSGSSLVEASHQLARFRHTEEAAMLDSEVKQRLEVADISVREEYSKLNWWPSTALEQTIEWFFFDYLNANAEPPERTSLYSYYHRRSSSRYGVGNFRVTDQRGYQHLIHCIAESFLKVNDPRLQLNSLVTGIKRSDDGVCVDVRRGSSSKILCAKYAVCTFSVGVLLSQHQQLFHPRLPPWKVRVINHFSMGNLLRIYVKFEHKFWQDVAEFIGRVDATRGRYSLIRPLTDLNGTFPDLTGANILVFSITRPFAAQIGSQTVRDTVDQVTAVLQEIYPEANVTLTPADVLISNWNKDPLYRGSYSNILPGARLDSCQRLAAPCGKLYFSGEATNKKHRGTVHGAYLSGTSTAQTIADKLASNQ